MAGSNSNGLFYKTEALKELLKLPKIVARQDALIETLENRWRWGWKIALAALALAKYALP